MEALSQRLKKSITGDDKAIHSIVTDFKEQVFSEEEQEQIHRYLKQAEKQSHHAIYLRALLYQYGYGVKVDVEIAFLMMREAAGKGNGWAIYSVGHYYFEGIGVTQSDENARKWLTLAASSPHYIADAMYDLGRMYDEGLGMNKDLVKAREWFERAAKKGHLKAKEKLVKLSL